MKIRIKSQSNLHKFAFTLTEMMIAIIIIGVLVAIAVPNFARVREKARIEKAKADLEILAAAIRQLAWDTGKWPGGIDRHIRQNAETWDLSTPAAGIIAADDRFPGWKGPYAPCIPLDPWGSKYFFDPDYYVSGQVYAVVGSFGPNKRGPNLYDRDDIYVILKTEPGGSGGPSSP